MEGIVIRVYPSGDDDLVLKVITSVRGKMSLFAGHARKSKKRFGSTMDLFDYGRLEFEEKKSHLHRLTAFSSLSSFPRIRRKLDRMTAANAICEVFDVLLPEEGHEDSATFRILLAAMRALEQAEGPTTALRVCFTAVLSLLDISGFTHNGAAPRPSAKNMERLLDQVEQLAERKLASRPAVESLIAALTKPEPE
jgi:DNA repair protein RecO